MEPRAALYELAATLFSFPPTQEILISAQQQVSGYEERLDFWDDCVLVAEVRGLSKALMEGRSEADLRTDHNRLFLRTSLNGAYAAESAFRNPMLGGSITTDLSAVYASCGFHIAGWFAGPDDHVAVQCLFMSLMGGNFIAMARDTRLNPSAYVSHLERQHGFLTRHLLQWIPLWEQHVRERGMTNLYRTAGGLTRILVETDRKKLIDYVKLIQGCGYNNYYRDRCARAHLQESGLPEPCLS
jgi:anaerobic sulfite reductase subunit A